MKRKILGVIALLLSAFGVNAQESGYERFFQVGFVSPLGSNGMQSHLTTNTLSFNVLGGYSAANRAFELGGLYNINLDYTSGVQLAGLVNYSGKLRGGVQLAGLVNISGDVDGVQFGGLVNVARRLRGVQFGLVNITGSSDDGVSIGLINIVKDGGKQEFEVGFSESLNTTVSFRLGSDHFYTIFSGGLNYLSEELNYGVGMGFGSHIDWFRGWGNEVEVMGYSLTEGGEFTRELNMLTQLKLTVSKKFHKHFKVFAGPVFNMTVSQYENPITKELGSSLQPWGIWSNDSDVTRLNSWIGFSAGVRF